MGAQRFTVPTQKQQDDQWQTNNVDHQLPHPQQQHHRLMPALVTFFFQINF
jgi:hypothetical protein